MSLKFGFSQFFFYFKECFIFSDNVSYMNFLLNKGDDCLSKSTVSKSINNGLRKKEANEICVNGVQYYADHYCEEYENIYIDKVSDRIDSFMSKYYIPAEQKHKIHDAKNTEYKLATLLVLAALADLQISAGFEINPFDDLNDMLDDKATSGRSDEVLISTDLNSALTNALAKAQKPISMKIYALSTTLIHSIVRCAKNCKFSNCRLLIRNLKDPEYNALFSGHVTVLNDLWRMMERDGVIDNLEICYYDSLPSEYNVILNDEMVIIGDYIFTDVDRSHVSIDNVMVISNTSSTGREIIANYTNRFDRSFEYFKLHGGDKII